jgi:hypothetical protein
MSGKLRLALVSFCLPLLAGAGFLLGSQVSARAATVHASALGEGGSCGKCDPNGSCIRFNSNLKCVEGPLGCRRGTDLCKVVAINPWF